MQATSSKIKPLLFLALPSLLLISESAMALSCNWRNSAPPERIRTVYFGNVLVQRDAAMGSVLATTWSQAYASGEGFMGCKTTWSLAMEVTLFNTLSSYGNKVYNTNIPGVGIRITSPDGDVFPMTKSMGGDVYAKVMTPGLTVQLIKTTSGLTGSGTLSSGRLGGFRIVSNPSFFADLNTSGVNTITGVACSVTNKSVNVALNPATKYDFKGIGSTAKAKDFNVTVNCNAGARVKMTLNGTGAGPRGVLALSAATKPATGIGIQVLKGTTPVAFGTALDFGTAGNGNTQLPLVARYYQTAETITPGSANATATFTLTYN